MSNKVNEPIGNPKLPAHCCGQCVFWDRKELATPQIGVGAIGVCYGAPPTAALVYDRPGGPAVAQRNVRPMLPESERPCGLFTTLASISGAAANSPG